LYLPDYRNSHHQKYCSRPECQAASHQVSQRRWSAKRKNRDYHSGPDQVQRVQAWRKEHPGYARKTADALQDLCSSQPVHPQEAKGDLNIEIVAKARPLQDLCLAQDPLFVGLVAHLTGALQEDIAPQIARFQSHGQTILRKGPGIAI
jgi:hypothetical protein